MSVTLLFETEIDKSVETRMRELTLPRGVVATEVYDTYWRFAARRQSVFMNRVLGGNFPWTDDRILIEYKFTNAYRAADRVSQFLIRNVIYSGDQSNEEVFFRTILFKLFNKIETWQILSEQIGEICWSGFNLADYNAELSEAMDSKIRIYSPAYIMPSAGKNGSGKKHSSHLQLLEQMMIDGTPQRIADADCMEEAYNVLLSYPMIGPFLAYQYATDLNYSNITNFSEMEFVQPGPGAIDGIHKCFSSLGGLSEPEAIRMVCDRQEIEFERLGIDFQDLWGRRLQLIDCQNLFCEISKYARVKHPDVAGVNNRTRIKQKFTPNFEPIEYWFPEKWGINDRIRQSVTPSVRRQQRLFH